MQYRSLSWLFVCVFFSGIILLPGTALAIPNLQLWIDPSLNPGAVYGGPTDGQSWVTASPSFTLSLLVKQEYYDEDVLGNPGRSIFLSLALADGVLPGTGSISVNGVPIAPMAFSLGNPGLPPHGVFDTYFAELDVTALFSGLPTTTIPNTQPGDPGTDDGLRLDLTLSISGFDFTHFDLYARNNRTGSIGGGNFAPFSHDAEFVGTGLPPIPEPSTLFLVFSGIMMLGTRYMRRNP